MSPLKAAETIIESLKSQPLMLAILLLNALGIGAALWFLTKLAEAQAARYQQLFDILRKCLPGGNT